MPTSNDAEMRPFQDRFQFVDDVHGRILLNNVERDAIDTPEFQRLFRIAQLGLVEIAYQTANHTRGAHSIGTCYAAQRLLGTLAHNQERGAFAKPTITKAEQVLIRLGALLHDIPHGPFSHDIEKKKHLIKRFSKEVKIKSANGPFEKHDDYKENPAFYIAVFDTKRSILARVLRAYSPHFYELLIKDPALDAEEDHHLKPFLALAPHWPGIEHELLPGVLFHLFAFEELDDARQHTLPIREEFAGPITDWHLGPAAIARELHDAWYQPFRHEIIGNTLSADLIDYLARDCARLDINGGIDENLLRYYVLTRSSAQPLQYRCAIDVFDHKRGIVRSDRLNDIFQMLEVRHQIHEKAVYHRVAQSSLAMLSRAITLGQQAERTLPSSPEQLTAESLYGFGTLTEGPNINGDIAMRGDEHFLARLTAHDHTPTRQLARKLAERRLFRPLMIVPGHRAANLIAGSFQRSEKTLRELATIIDAPAYAPFFNVISATIEALLRHEFTSPDLGTNEPGSAAAFLQHFTNAHAALQVPASHRVLFWTLPYKQLFKDPAIVVTTPGGEPRSLHEIYELPKDKEPEDIEFSFIKERVAAGIHDADVRYAQLWKIYVFLSDGLFYGGSIAKLLRNTSDYAHKCAGGGDEHGKHLQSAGILAARAISVTWDHWDKETANFAESKHEAAAAFLNGTPSDRMMSKLITNVLDWPNVGKHASEVKFEQYQHGDGPTQTNCRDIRYRFEEASTVASTHPMKRVLDALRCTRTFFPSELNELASTLLRSDDDELAHALATAANPAAADQLLRERAITTRLEAAGILTPVVSIVPDERPTPTQLPLGAKPVFMDDQAQAQHFLTLAREARNGRSYGVAHGYVASLLRIPNEDGALDRIRTQAQVLSVRTTIDELAKTASDGAEAETLVDALDKVGATLSGITTPDETMQSEIAELHGIIEWRRKAAVLRRVPLALLQRGDGQSPEGQDRFVHVAQEQLKTRKYRARTPREKWDAIAKEAWENETTHGA